MVEGHRLGRFVGEPTAGTSGDANLVVLPGGYQLEWTGAKVLKHDSSRHHGLGIQPNYEVTPTRTGVAEGRDEVLERAIAVLTG